ncbi:MAG: hypothetical protein A2151_05170 [Candidatus Muproteobacteria bacterium RBG_16_65_34]|uniref:Uncharacterized protein n=1 Tax=Candidatus Muproteobacteria bacterium RBG_16_65_34 TaxID=1817760 RepID=A0A1F6TSF0_9PROT|nr:MAG: hypothetical protein A2151_05170 [Candidatus Muproteobacteria bacterium RBG_16_65_34]
MRRLCSAANLPEAYLLKQLLEQAGIEARVFNEHAQGALGEIPFTHAYPEVWLINDADAVRAEELIRTYERTEPSAVTRACPACGEQNPQGFEICWRCGAPIS